MSGNSKTPIRGDSPQDPLFGETADGWGIDALVGITEHGDEVLVRFEDEQGWWREVLLAPETARLMAERLEAMADLTEQAAGVTL